MINTPYLDIFTPVAMNNNTKQKVKAISKPSRPKISTNKSSNKNDNSSHQEQSQHSHKSKNNKSNEAKIRDDKYTYRFAVLLTCLVAVTACFLYLFFPSSARLFSNDRPKRPSIPVAHPDANNNKNDDQNTPQEEYKSWREHNCTVLIQSAVQLMARGTEWYEMALDLLASCALQEENNHIARWNMGLIVSRMGPLEEAEVWLEEAISLAPGSTVYLRGIADLYFSHKRFSKSEKYFESYLEVKGGMDEWGTVIKQLYLLRDDEKSFLLDIFDSEELKTILSQLIGCYMHLGSLVKADYSYDVLSSLFPDDKLIHQRYSIFSFGIGHILRGATELERHTLLQIITGSDTIHINEVYQLVSIHSLLLVTSGINSHILSMTRIYLYQSLSSLKMINEACQLSENLYQQLSTLPVQQKAIKRVFEKCFLQQNLLNYLLKHGTQLHSENQFGWTPLLQSCSLGGVSLVSYLVDKRAALSTVNALEQNCLHIAVMYGNIDLVEYLIKQQNFNYSQVDVFGRSPGDYACHHGWLVDEFYNSLNLNAPSGCIIKPLTVPRVQSPGGGWLGTPTNIPIDLISSRCNIDVVKNTITTEEFFLNYLSIQKPVLIRNVLANDPNKLKLNFQRLSLAKKHGMLQFSKTPIPYGESFGYIENITVTPLSEFLQFMSKYNSDMNEVKFNDVIPPDYIFQTIPRDSLLMEHFKLPYMFNPEQTNIIPRQMQFFVGPALSGSPPHFHSHSWNLLIYGRKKWFLYPPHRAFYSKSHVLDWYRSSAPLNDQHTISCIQEQGDVMYVPDMWGHAVINLREVIGIAQEFDHGLTEFSI